MIGGATGLLAGLGMLTLSQLSPAGMAGWLTMAGVLAGAAGGGIVGALAGPGLSRKQARPYARGSTLVAVRADNECALKVQSVLRQGGAARLHESDAEYREDGWEPFDEEAPVVKSNDPASGQVRYVDRIPY
jgi:hypothetical protein